ERRLGVLPCVARSSSWSCAARLAPGAEEAAEAEEDERRRDREHEVEVSEEPERVQEDDEEGGERERDERRGAPRTSDGDRDETDDDPDQRPREPTGELIQSQPEPCASVPVRKVVVERVRLPSDRLEAGPILRVLECEVPAGRRRPDLAYRLIGSRDPDDLPRRDRLPPRPPARGRPARGAP